MDIFAYKFFVNALWAIVILSVAMSLLGTYIVTRRMVFVAGGITHACFGGLGLGYWLGFAPSVGATVFALGGALGARWLGRSVRSDSAIAAMWAVGMALGIFFIFMCEGYVPELEMFLFGNVLTVSDLDLWVFGGFMLLTCVVYLLLRRLIVAVSFDASFARTRHLPVRSLELVMLVLVSLGIVLSIQMVGIMLLMSLVSLPQMCAERFTRRYGRMILYSTLFSLGGCVSGLLVSWYLGVPASACIVLMLTLLYVLTRLRRV